MRSGPIQPEDKQEWIDQREKELSLWEQGKKGTQIDLPWTELSSPDSLNEVQSLVANARSVILAIGTTTTSRKLIDAVLQYLPAQCRLYVYGASDLETELVQKIAGMGDRVLARLGHRPPADWLIVDKGSDGRLVVGPTAEHQKWVLPVSGDLARSLFEAFCVLFWFHATSEALPDDNGDVAFRPPLAAPFKDPGPDIPLPAGRLLLGGELDDPVSDAEFRISPNASDPGHARVLFIPPTDGLASGGTGRPVDIGLPKALCRRGHRVLWVDTGLPRTTVTRQRMVMNLVEAPIALQIEWPAATAINFLHCFERAAQQPAWEFHPARRLDAIKGEVLLNGATQPAKTVPSVSLDAGDVDAPLLDFDSARPARLPDVPPLALEAAIKWRLVPATLPRGARRAEIVRHWTAVDEWTSRTVESLRDALDELENQEGLLSKLRQWLPSRDGNSALEREKLREKLRDELDDLGESPPSQIKTPPMPERALPPVLVLISDGQPTDDFNGGLQALMAEPWGTKAVRLAIAIGADADIDVLQRFIGHAEIQPLQANNAQDLVNYIRWASTAVLQAASAPASQTQSAPAGVNVPLPPPPKSGPTDANDVW